MTKRQRIFTMILFLVVLLVKEEIYGFLFKIHSFKNTEQVICNLNQKQEETKEKEIAKYLKEIKNTKYPLEHSKVLYRDIYRMKAGITIYKGKENGIKKNNLVINEKGLIGIITKVNKNSSEVQLLTNSETNLSVKVGDSYGILKAVQGKLIIEGINNLEKISLHSPVVTSDVSIYPEDILIGYVEEMNLDRYEIENKITVVPAVDFEYIQYLSIIKNERSAS